ncbi:glycosyltransferase family 2 protein [Candidatus Wolfebacteria bacterium]|nr:glycosyltransferase family 2 protein [Candidatus Wolfebacteria bacterium]
MYRFFELFPGFLTWGTFALLAVLAWRIPIVASLFVLLFSLYWVVRVIYFHFHLQSSFRKMRANLKINWLDRIKTLEKSEKTQPLAWDDIYHLVILPMYKEPYAVIKETFDVLTRANYPTKKMIIALTVEEDGGENARSIVQRIEKEYGQKFYRFFTTIHPFGLPGELMSKGSNEAWGARRVKAEVIDVLKIPYDRILASVFDADTQIYPDYFGRLAYLFLTAKNPQRASYQPIPLFMNNVFEAPIFSRVISFFPTAWQMMQQSRQEQLTTFTSQSMPFQALVEVDFWDTHLVSEDSLIFWKFYLHYDGRWRTEPMHYPVSLDANAAPSLWETAKNIYKQQRRWAWGIENIPYMLDGFRKHPKIRFREKIFWSYVFIEGFYSWATTPFIMFLGGWLPIFLGGEDFNTTLLSYNLPRTTGFLMNLLTVGLFASAILSINMLPPRPTWFRSWHYIIYLLQWAFIPVVIIIFSALPAVDAQTRMIIGGKFRLGFWPTPKTRRVIPLTART